MEKALGDAAVKEDQEVEKKKKIEKKMIFMMEF